MSLVSEIRELEGRHFMAGTLTFLGIVGPGYLTVYHYHPELLEKYDVIKLSIFAASLSVPVLFLAMAIVVMVSPKSNEPSPREALLLGAFGSGPIQYIALLLAYHCDARITEMYKWVAELLVGFAILSAIAQRGKKETSSQQPIAASAAATPAAKAQSVTPESADH